MNNGVMIKAPSWVGEMELLGLLRQDLQFKLAYCESHCRVFERKYLKTLICLLWHIPNMKFSKLVKEKPLSHAHQNSHHRRHV